MRKGARQDLPLPSASHWGAGACVVHRPGYCRDHQPEPGVVHGDEGGGAGYLIYLGYKSLTNTSRICLDGLAQDGQASTLQALRTGFLTNALNPKTMLFVISAYTQVVQPGSPLALDFAYGAFMSFAHWLWFSLVAVFFSVRCCARQ